MNIDIDIEKLHYLLWDMEDKINWNIDQVLNDSKDDPHYSAVFVANQIKCYIHIMNELGKQLPYNSVEEFFAFNAYTEEEFNAFENRRKYESTYYRGIQY